MKTHLLIVVISLFTHVLAYSSDAADIIIQDLAKKPDLKPLVSREATAKLFEAYSHQILQKYAGLTQVERKSLVTARASLAPKLSEVDSIILYSLLPIESRNLRLNYSVRYKLLEKLPRFHDYPILGSIEIDASRGAARWADFLRAQIVPGGESMCDFMPRHGFRLVTRSQTIDILMCFQCNQLMVVNHQPIGLDPAVFSHVVRDVLNLLFDLNSVNRDKP